MAASKDRRNLDAMKSDTEDDTSSVDKHMTRSQSVDSERRDERETRTSIQKTSKEAREMKRLKREAIIKERLEELEVLEKSIKDGTNVEYHKILSDIENKRSKLIEIANQNKLLSERNIINFFNTQKYAAHSQYHWEKLQLRRSMIRKIQEKINTLEQEYHSNNSSQSDSLDEDQLTDWVPLDRPSMISSLTLGLSEKDIEHDIELSKQNEYPYY